jgi:hypothetical protein
MFVLRNCRAAKSRVVASPALSQPIGLQLFLFSRPRCDAVDRATCNCEGDKVKYRKPADDPSSCGSARVVIEQAMASITQTRQERFAASQTMLTMIRPEWVRRLAGEYAAAKRPHRPTRLSK